MRFGTKIVLTIVLSATWRLQPVIRQGGSLHHVGSTVGGHGHCPTHLPINLHGHLNLAPTGQRFVIGRIALRED